MVGAVTFVAGGGFVAVNSFSITISAASCRQDAEPRVCKYMRAMLFPDRVTGGRLDVERRRCPPLTPIVARDEARPSGRVPPRIRLRDARQSAPEALGVSGPPAGWYADPDGQPIQRYWDGRAWTDHTRPAADFTGAAPGAEPDRDQVALIAGVLAIVLGVVGAICSLQSVSVASGAGIVWVGAALVIGGAVVALAIPRVRTWIKIVTAIGAILCVANAVSISHQLDNKRHQIQQILNDIPQ